MTDALGIAVMMGAAAIAGAVNSVAGGGTLLTFPAIQAAGFASTVANATSTTALWPGQLTSLLGLRSELGEARREALPLIAIGLVGGIVGAGLLLLTPSRLFDRLVPLLILGATVLFMAQEPISRRMRERPDHRPSPLVWPFLLLVAVYGGYFGAGIGILTLSALSLLGHTQIHRMNALKAIFTLPINGVAAAIFIVNGLVDWRIAGWLSIGALFGGYFGAGAARRIGAKNVRRVVIGIGFALAAYQLWKVLS
jgi:uncharacterized membrane protein YfcA